MNALVVQPESGTVTKMMAPSHCPGMWRSLDREVAALHLLSEFEWAPQLKGRGDRWVSMSKLTGQPIIRDSGNPTYGELERVCEDAGRVLRIHHMQYSRANTSERRALWLGSGAKWNDAVQSLVHQSLDLLGQVRLPNEELYAHIAKEAHTLDFSAIPKERTAFVHGDFIGKNTLVHEGMLTGVVDFEWSHFGDPEYDFVRMLWLGDVGRDPRTLFLTHSRRAFTAGYGGGVSVTRQSESYRIYGLLMALGHVLSDSIFKGKIDPRTTRWLSDFGQGLV